MASERWLVPVADGVRRVTAPFDEVAWSPGGRWVACWRPSYGAGERDDRAWVLDAADGEVACALDAPRDLVAQREPGSVVAAAWASPERLLVLRRTPAGSHLLLHELPDGGVVARAALGAPGGGVQVSRDGARAYVTPPSWPGASALVPLPALDPVTRVDPAALLAGETARARRPEQSGESPALLDPGGERVATAWEGVTGGGAAVGVFEARERPLLARASTPLPLTRLRLRWLSRAELVAAAGVAAAASPLLVTADAATTRATARPLVEPPVRLPSNGPRDDAPPVRGLDVDLDRRRVLLTWDVFPERRFQLVDVAGGTSRVVPVDPRREWAEVARLDPAREGSMLVARILVRSLRVERVDLATGAAAPLCGCPEDSARAVERFELLAPGAGALLRLDDFPGRRAWLHVDAAALAR